MYILYEFQSFHFKVSKKRSKSIITFIDLSYLILSNYFNNSGLLVFMDPFDEVTSLLIQNKSRKTHLNIHK